MLAWDKRVKESAVWLGLFFTLIGLVPGIGSLLKGVLKLILKSAPIEKILAVFNHFMQGNGVKWLKELKAGKLKAYAQQAAAQGHAIFAAAVDNLSRLKQHMPARLTALRAKTEDLLAGLRQAKAMLDDQFDRIGRELIQKLDTILAKRTDDLQGGSAKGAVKKQQRAEAPEGDMPPCDHDGQKNSPKRDLKKEYADIMAKDDANTIKKHLSDKGTRFSKEEKDSIKKIFDLDEAKEKFPNGDFTEAKKRVDQMSDEFSSEEIQEIKRYLFDNDEWTGYDPNNAAAWKRLQEGTATDVEETLLKHERVERLLKEELEDCNIKFDHRNAHFEADELYNFFIKAKNGPGFPFEKP